MVFHFKPALHGFFATWEWLYGVQSIRYVIQTLFVSFTFRKILFVFLKVANFAMPRELETSKFMNACSTRDSGNGFEWVRYHEFLCERKTVRRIHSIPIWILKYDHKKLASMYNDVAHECVHRCVFDFAFGYWFDTTIVLRLSIKLHCIEFILFFCHSVLKRFLCRIFAIKNKTKCNNMLLHIAMSFEFIDAIDSQARRCCFVDVAIMH